MAEKKSMSPVTIILIIVGVLVVLAVVGVVGMGVLAAVGLSGTRSYIAQSKAVEGKSEVMRLAASIVSCAAVEKAEKGTDTLPDSAPPVPATLGDVGGKKYMSSPSDWSAPAYSCGKFSMSMPQYFQYEWHRDTPTTGKAIARADLDADGKAEIVFEVPVTCSPSCTAGTLATPVGP
jgi:hypothetical protein